MDETALGQMIEAAPATGRAHEYAIFEAELQKLPTSQLRALLPLVGIRYRPNEAVDREECLRVMHETTWAEFFIAFRKVTGQRHRLDRTT